MRRSNRIEALAAKFQVKKTEFELERDSHLHVRREGEGGSGGGAEGRLTVAGEEGNRQRWVLGQKNKEMCVSA